MLQATKVNNDNGALQQPLQSGFSATSTTTEVIKGIDLHGKTVIAKIATLPNWTWVNMLVWFISGETKIIQPDAHYVFKAGDIFSIPRIQLATIINYPKDGLPYSTFHRDFKKTHSLPPQKWLLQKKTVQQKIN